MSQDLTNTSFSRNIPYAGELTSEPDDNEGHVNGRPDVSLKLDSILIEEFKYASTVANRALEERSRMFNLYLVLLGVIGSGLAGIYQFGGNLRVYTPGLVAGFLLIGGLICLAFFVNVINVTHAFRDSTRAMAMIKEYYIREIRSLKPDIEKAFLWRLPTIPVRGGSIISSISSAMAACLGAICFAAAAFIAALQFSSDLAATLHLSVGGTQTLAAMLPVVLAGLVAVIDLVACANYYRYSFNRYGILISRASKAVAQ